MQATKKALPFMLIISIVFVFMPHSALAADYGVSNAVELAAALGSIADGDTIRLTADIDYTNGISIAGMAVTFDLNGHTLNIASSAGNGLDVGVGGVVNVTGSGALNAASSADDSYGVNAHNGGRATVTNATATGDNGTGAHAINAGSSVHVTGNVRSADNIGALARNEGTVTVDGNAQGVTGADATGTNTLVEIAGNVTGNKGVACALGGVVHVGGNITATGNCTDPRAISIAYGGTITVSGSVTASGAGTVGAWIYDGGTATIDGTLNAPVYIELQEIEKTAASGVPGAAPYESYFVYTDGTNTVRVGHILSAVIDPASASFDKNPVKSANVSSTITWNNAAVVTDIKAGGVSIGAGSYSISGNTLTITKEYLAAQSVASLAFSVEFDAGDPAALTIAISNTPPITGLPDSYTMYVGGRAIWSPLPAGGAWDYDSKYFSVASGSSATFKALKAGTSVVTYTVNGISHSITVTIRESALPQTGQNGTAVWALVLLAVIFGAAAFALKAKSVAHKQR